MIKKFVSHSWRLGTSTTAKHLYWLFSGNTVSIILTFFTTILVARVLTTAENGIFLALFTFANLLSELGEFGLGSSLSNFIPPLLLKKDTQKAKTYTSTAFWLVTGLNLIITLGAILFAKPLAYYLFANVSAVNVIITSVMEISLALMLFLTFALSAHKKFIEVSAVNVGYSFIRLLLLVIWLIWSKLSLTAILILYVIAAVFGWIYALALLGKNSLTKQVSTDAAKKLAGFSGFLAIQKGIIATSSRLDMLMLVPLSGAFEAGVYGAASYWPRAGNFYRFLISLIGLVIVILVGYWANKELTGLRKDPNAIYKNSKNYKKS